MQKVLVIYTLKEQLISKISIKDLQIPYTSLEALVSRVVAQPTLSLIKMPYMIYRISMPQVKAHIITKVFDPRKRVNKKGSIQNAQESILIPYIKSPLRRSIH